MKYAKLVNGVLYPAMPIFVADERFFFKPTEERLLEAGYLPVQYTTAPETTNGQKPTYRWVQTENAIVQEWSVPEVKRKPSTYEIARSMVIQTADDNTALRMKGYYPTFESVVGQKVNQGFKFTHADKLWKTMQPDLTIQGHYPPGVGTESLYEEVCETHDGTLYDAIPYEGNMALENGKHYTQDGVVYRCIRDTGNPVYHALAELVGLYVEAV